MSMFNNLALSAVDPDLFRNITARQGSFDTAYLPTVSDPDKTYADLTRREYMDFVNNYGKFENELIDKAQTDTSIIDQAREDAPAAAELTAGIQERNLSRYGGTLTAAQRQQMGGSLQRANTLGNIQAVNDARVAQKDANSKLLADLINIGQGVNRTAQGQLGSSAQNATQLKNAYQQAKANSKAQTYSTVGQLGSMAIMAFMMSDRRVKEDIKKVDVSPSGINVYTFKYKNTEGTYKGVMADEVPWAAAEAPNGYQMVDYNKVDVDFERVA